ncbi:hypothetical protein CPB84DRAFT_1744526 [Gymnopilus junonius]|uniref:Uncharacterized protein n=1 Tax=Gymnopilus junonius TaxID=109634 RepID=A0A9P5NWC3_GYMJU|nr:hypothetical protein CPB84DRAFT_1744526 [Gymnopilus junonius]
MTSLCLLLLLALALCRLWLTHFSAMFRLFLQCLLGHKCLKDTNKKDSLIIRWKSKDGVRPLKRMSDSGEDRGHVWVIIVDREGDGECRKPRGNTRNDMIPVLERHFTHMAHTDVGQLDSVPSPRWRIGYWNEEDKKKMVLGGDQKLTAVIALQMAEFDIELHITFCKEKEEEFMLLVVGETVLVMYAREQQDEHDFGGKGSTFEQLGAPHTVAEMTSMIDFGWIASGESGPDSQGNETTAGMKKGGMRQAVE